MVQKLGIFRRKQGFGIHVLLSHSRIFGFLPLNHCMKLHLVIVCILTRLSLGRKVDTLELL